MPKLCVTTAYDRGFGQLGNYAASTIQNYADTLGFDARVISDFQMKGRHPAWFRIQLIQELFDEGYEWVLWVDADALVLRTDQSILDEVEEDKHLYFVSHKAGHPNSGVMLWRNCDWSKDLLKLIWSKDHFAFEKLWEQSALCEILGHNKVNGQGEDALNTEYYKHIKRLGTDWNAMLFKSDSTSENPIIFHFAGLRGGQRSNLMRQYWRQSISTDGGGASNPRVEGELRLRIQHLEAELRKLKKSQLSKIAKRFRFAYEVLIGKARLK